MNKEYIAVIDSGIGGLTVLKKLEEKISGESILYLGDNLNAPYGNRTLFDLQHLAIEKINSLLKYPIKMLVIACNTLSMNLYKYIKDYIGVKTFGVFPPLEGEMIKNSKTLILSTYQTYKKLKEQNISENIKCLGLKNLTKIIEDNKYSLSSYRTNILVKDEINDAIKSTLSENSNVKCRFDNIILGCTHYPLIKKNIFDHFLPKKIIDGSDNTVLQVKKYLNMQKRYIKSNENEIIFLGDCAYDNEKFYNEVVKEVKF